VRFAGLRVAVTARSAYDIAIDGTNAYWVNLNGGSVSNPPANLIAPARSTSR